MVRPSKKGAKSKAEVATEAKKKKDILDKVAQSNLPTKTILKELGISRSTYYSWLKRYEEEGEEGLLDSRSLSKAREEVKEEAPPVEDVEPKPPEVVVAEEVVEEKPVEPPAETIREEIPTPPTPEETVVTPEEPVAAPVEDEPVKREEVVVADEMPPFEGGEAKKGMGGYAFIAILLLVIGLLVSISLSNYNTYHLRQSGNTLTLWKGKFAPRGVVKVESFEPLEVGDSDVSALTSTTFTGEDALNKAIYAFILDQINGEIAKGDKADTQKINLLLARAQTVVGASADGDRSMANIRFQLAEKRVAIAERELHKVYEIALPAYEEAASLGLADLAMLETKIEAMQQALALKPEVTPEAPAEEAEAAVSPAVVAEEAETPVVPEAPAEEAETSVAEEAKTSQAETTVAPPGEAEEVETVVEVGPAAGEDETAATTPEKETEAAAAETKAEEEGKKPSSFLDWVRSRMEK